MAFWKHNCYLSMFGQTIGPKIIGDVHLWGQNIQKQQHHNHIIWVAGILCLPTTVFV